MTRRTIELLITLTLCLLWASLVAEAQQPTKVRRIGWLSAGFPSTAPNAREEAFRQRLRDLGWVGGQNLTMEVRWAEGRPERLPELAAELVRLQVEVIVAGGAPAIRAAQHATRTIPIVMAGTSDAVAQGFIASLARPGGNITGLSDLSAKFHGKRLELLKGLGPEVPRIALLTTPAQRGGAALQEIQRAAQGLGVELQVQKVGSPEAFDSAFAAMRTAGASAFLVLADPFLFEGHHRDITALALQSQLPGMYPWRMYPEAGGLMSYGPSLPAL